MWSVSTYFHMAMFSLEHSGVLTGTPGLVDPTLLAYVSPHVTRSVVSYTRGIVSPVT